MSSCFIQPAMPATCISAGWAAEEDRKTQKQPIRVMVPWDTLRCAVAWGWVSVRGETERESNHELRGRRKTLKNKYSLKILISN